VLNREVNTIVRHLKSLAGENYNNPSKLAVIMQVVRVVALAIREQNPKFNTADFEKRIADY